MPGQGRVGGKIVTSEQERGRLAAHDEHQQQREDRTDGGEREGLANFEFDRRLMEEINILKLEGSLFCFDPKEAKRRRGKLTLADARKAARDGRDQSELRPAVGARVQGAAGDLPQGRGDRVQPHGGWALPLQRHRVVQRARARHARQADHGAGSTSKQLFDAIMQLRRTGSHRDRSTTRKPTSGWSAAFTVLNSAILRRPRRDHQPMRRCSSIPKIVESINRRHVATFNFHRLSSLDTIGLVLYKRIFFHFSNLMHEQQAARGRCGSPRTMRPSARSGSGG